MAKHLLEQVEVHLGMVFKQNLSPAQPGLRLIERLHQFAEPRRVQQAAVPAAEPEVSSPLLACSPSGQPRRLPVLPAMS